MKERNNEIYHLHVYPWMGLFDKDISIIYNQVILRNKVYMLMFLTITLMKPVPRSLIKYVCPKEMQF